MEGAGQAWRCFLCNQPAEVWCRNDRAYLCASCDHEVHQASPIAWKHERIALYPHRQRTQGGKHSEALSQEYAAQTNTAHAGSQPESTVDTVPSSGTGGTNFIVPDNYATMRLDASGTALPLPTEVNEVEDILNPVRDPFACMGSLPMLPVHSRDRRHASRLSNTLSNLKLLGASSRHARRVTSLHHSAPSEFPPAAPRPDPPLPGAQHFPPGPACPPEGPSLVAPSSAALPPEPSPPLIFPLPTQPSPNPSPPPAAAAAQPPLIPGLAAVSLPPAAPTPVPQVPAQPGYHNMAMPPYAPQQVAYCMMPHPAWGAMMLPAGAWATYIPASLRPPADGAAREAQLRARRQRYTRFRHKKHSISSGTRSVKYEERKRFADARPRQHGRFISKPKPPPPSGD